MKNDTVFLENNRFKKNKRKNAIANHTSNLTQNISDNFCRSHKTNIILFEHSINNHYSGKENVVRRKCVACNEKKKTRNSSQSSQFWAETRLVLFIEAFCQHFGNPKVINYTFIDFFTMKNNYLNQYSHLNPSNMKFIMINEVWAIRLKFENLFVWKIFFFSVLGQDKSSFLNQIQTIASF